MKYPSEVSSLASNKGDIKYPCSCVLISCRYRHCCLSWITLLSHIHDSAQTVWNKKPILLGAVTLKFEPSHCLQASVQGNAMPCNCQLVSQRVLQHRSRILAYSAMRIAIVRKQAGKQERFLDSRQGYTYSIHILQFFPYFFMFSYHFLNITPELRRAVYSN